MPAHLATKGALRLPAADRVYAGSCGLHAPERVLVLADAAVYHEQLCPPSCGRINGHRHMADARGGRRIASGACREQAAGSAGEVQAQCLSEATAQPDVCEVACMPLWETADRHHNGMRHLVRSGATPWCLWGLGAGAARLSRAAWMVR